MNRKRNTKVFQSIALLSAVILADASAQNPQETRPNLVDCDGLSAGEVVTIKFNANSCPSEAYPADFNVEDTQKFICWVSVDSAGNRKVFDFELFFDPFQGNPLGSGGTGRVRKKIDSDAPLTSDGVEYKYTIEGKDCSSTNPDDKYLDPRFWVRR